MLPIIPPMPRRDLTEEEFYELGGSTQMAVVTFFHSVLTTAITLSRRLVGRYPPTAADCQSHNISPRQPQNQGQ